MQLHKRLTIEEVRLVLDWYEQKLVNQDEALAKLGLKRRQFFTFLKTYRVGKLKALKPDRVNSHRRIPLPVEAAVKAELIAEKRLIDDAGIPVNTYNYQAVRIQSSVASGLLCQPRLFGAEHELGTTTYRRLSPKPSTPE